MLVRSEANPVVSHDYAERSVNGALIVTSAVGAAAGSTMAWAATPTSMAVAPRRAIAVGGAAAAIGLGAAALVGTHAVLDRIESPTSAHADLIPIAASAAVGATIAGAGSAALPTGAMSRMGAIASGAAIGLIAGGLVGAVGGRQ